MIYYFIIFVFLAFSLLMQTDIKKSNVRLLKVFSFVLVLIIGGLRFQVGADWEAYELFFLDLNSWEDVVSSRFEKLFVLLNYGVKLIYNSYSFFIFILFLFSFSLKYSYIKKYSPDVFISLIVYLYTIFLIYDINGLRQGIALGLSMLSLKYIIERKLINFAVIITIACFFHTSAIIFYPFYFLARININNKKVFLTLITIILFAMPLRYFFQNSSFFQIMMETDSFSHYSAYTDGDSYKLNIPIFSVAVFQRLIIFILFLLTYNNIDTSSEIKISLRNGYFIGITLFLFFSFSSEMAARLSFYYKSFEIIMIPLIVYSFKNKHKRFAMLVLFVVFAIIGISRLLSIPDGYLVPYNNLLFLN